MATAGEVYPGVTIDPQVHHGRPVRTGTRIAVEVIVGTLAAGESVESIIRSVRSRLQQILKGHEEKQPYAHAHSRRS